MRIVRRGMALIALAGLLFGSAPIQAFGQQQPAPRQPNPDPTPTPAPAPRPPQTGDFVWTFGQEPPFHDQRVATALAALTQARVMQAVTMTYADPEVRDGLPQPASNDQIMLLLAAAGIEPSSLREVGQCKIWAAPSSPADVHPRQPLEPEEAGKYLGGAFKAGLSSLGLQIQPCTRTFNPDEAHLLVWIQGTTPPVVPSRREPTFLTSSDLVPAPGQQPQGGRGEGAPLPPATGNAGLHPSSARSTTVSVGLAMLTAVLASVSRMVTARHDPKPLER